MQKCPHSMHWKNLLSGTRLQELWNHGVMRNAERLACNALNFNASNALAYALPFNVQESINRFQFQCICIRASFRRPPARAYKWRHSKIPPSCDTVYFGRMCRIQKKASPPSSPLRTPCACPSLLSPEEERKISHTIISSRLQKGTNNIPSNRTDLGQNQHGK